MASTSQVQSDVPVELQWLPLRPSTARSTDAVVSDAHLGEGETVPEPLNLPDIYKPEWQRDGMPDTEFYRKYPPDPWGEEASPNARVWKVYRDQQDLSHNAMLDGWNKTLDVLLIFAGLFSAVLTAFLIESYKVLQPDYTQYVAAFLYAAAVSHNGTGSIFPALDRIVAPDRFIQTSVAQRWTNGLWFSSLVISLAVALLCILIKQWLDSYDSHVSATSPSPRHWARRHKLYHNGLKKWGLPGLISFLPLLLHVSLFLFFVGLVLFLRPLDTAISYSLLVMVTCIGAFYVLSLVLPAWRVECPSYTPLLAQALLVVSRPISSLLYVIGQLDSGAQDPPSSRSESEFVLSALARRMVKWLYSIQQRASQQLERETHAISTCEQELDGYALSALMDMPTDTNMDVVNAACEALGAVTSACTIEVLFRNGPDNAYLYKIRRCFDDVPDSMATGFAITSLERLHRAYHAMWAENGPYRPLILWQVDARSSLGIDGLLMSALDDELRGCINLIPQLQSLPLSGNSSPMLPLRSTCLTFMNQYAQRHSSNAPLFRCFLLVFCAGRFAFAERQELLRALRSVETVLTAQCSIILPAHDRGELNYICAVLNGLWHMLVDRERHHVDTATAQMVADQAYHCYLMLFLLSEPAAWVHLSGLSAFCRSPAFGQCVTSIGSLADYRQMLRYPMLAECSEAQVAEYWLCRATLLRPSWDYAPLPDDISTIGRIQWEIMPRTERGPYATLDDWYEPILRDFLDTPNAIATWTGANSPDHANNVAIELARLALRISIVLCRRQRLGRANDVFIRGLFAGSFLFARFRDLVSRYDQNGHRSFEDTVLDLAKHCLKLSPEACADIRAELEQIGEAGSELHERAVALAQMIREGSALSAECSPDCPCMIEIPVGRPTRGWRDVCNELATRFRRGSPEVATVEHV